MPELLDGLLRDIRACRICRETPQGGALPHEPRPVLQAGRAAPILLAGQAPGARVHASGKPFTDPSGERLRAWLGVSQEEFYDESLFSIVPMGFCYPGTDARGADYPPRPECRAHWHDRLFATLPPPQLTLLIGQYAQDYHFARLGLAAFKSNNLGTTILRWREILAAAPHPVVVLPHPSWRNNGWIRKNPTFENEILPYLRPKIRTILAPRGADATL